jgi:hypothetical protein
LLEEFHLELLEALLPLRGPSFHRSPFGEEIFKPPLIGLGTPSALMELEREREREERDPYLVVVVLILSFLQVNVIINASL